MIQILLASSSPRRRALLKSLGFPLRSLKPNLSETRLAHESAKSYVKRLAVSKAERGAARAREGETIVAADTVVVLGNRIFGKPTSSGDHGAKLRSLNGRVHRVLTGVSVRRGGRVLAAVEESRVRFRKISATTRRAYVRAGEGRGKAGGYSIQAPLSGLLVESVRGSFSNVVGLPLDLTLRLIRRVQR